MCISAHLPRFHVFVLVVVFVFFVVFFVEVVVLIELVVRVIIEPIREQTECTANCHEL